MHRACPHVDLSRIERKTKANAAALPYRLLVRIFAYGGDHIPVPGSEHALYRSPVDSGCRWRTDEENAEQQRAWERKPIASGSIAQVHRATRNGQVLAVKVRHPKVGTRLRLDVTLLAFGARCLEVFPPLRALRLSDTVSRGVEIMTASARWRGASTPSTRRYRRQDSPVEFPHTGRAVRRHVSPAVATGPRSPRIERVSF